ncbi:hypothetical protein Mapa_008473 [Marchantia paleacea]|nr:hypothetical protein Mapa_008473 [Marchantia paleacea]
MFAMASDSGLSHPFSMESALNMKHPFGISPEPKSHPELKPHRQTVMIEENRMAIDTSSPKPSQIRADSETVRKKLRESLVSALEMVVGKQVVKSVLGVGKDLTEEEKDDKSSLSGQMKRENEEEALLNKENQSAVGSEPHGVSVHDMKVDDSLGGEQTASGATLPSTCPPVVSDSNVEMNESPSKKAKCSKDDVSQVAEETKGGLQLMEQVKQVTWDIEAHLFSYNGGVNKKYKEKARSLLFNLKDKSNPELRARVFSGEITPQILVRMTGEQLASKELSQWRTAKAEAFASMVVLTDADVDPRRIVKKTHKGEFQVMKEADLSPSVDPIELTTSSFPIMVKKDPEEGGKADLSPGSNSRSQDSNKNQRKSSSSSTDDRQGERSSDCGAAVEGLGGELPTIMSLDEYIDTRDEAPSHRSESVHTTPEGRTENKVSLSMRESATLLTPTGSPSHMLESNTNKNNKSQSVRNAEVASSTVTLSKKRDRESAGLVWEGSVQLSATRFAPVDGIFKSGERLELKDWPKSVEIKGRVRLGALDKFLQDLQLSRSRTVTVMSLCPSDRQGSDLKQVRAYLREMADQYRMGDRAGFVEPAQGFELYLLAPGCASLDVLGDLPSATSPNVERDDEVLVGVVVWRRNQSQGVPSARGPDQQIGSLKKVSLSNQVSESPTKVNTTPMHWTEIPSSGGALPTSLKTASAHVNVSGNSSMHSTQSHGDTSAIRDPSLRREWPPASGLQLSPIGVPTIRVTENGHGAMTDSLFLPHQSVELEDVPPGFLPRPLPTFPQGRPAGANIDSKERVPVIQPPYVGGVPGASSLLPDRGRETTEAPPGFWPRSQVKGLPVTSQRIHTSSHDDDDDDLPEFNFEAEGVMAPQTTANVLPNQSQFLSPQNPSAPPSESPLHLANLHVSDSCVRFQSHMNPLPSPMEFQSVPPGLPPSRHMPLQEESFVPRPSLHHGPILDGWKSSDIRSRESVQQSLHHEVARPLAPQNPDSRNLPLRGARDELLHREEEFRHYGLESQQRGLTSSHEQQRSFGAATPGPLGVKPAVRTYFGTGVRETLTPGSRNDLPEWCPPSVSNLQPVQRASISSPLSYESALHIRQQPPPPVHVVVQQHTVSKSTVVPNWVRGPAPQQPETRYDYSRQVSAGITPSKWQINSSQIHHNSRSLHPSRKLETREKERVIEHSVKDSDRRRGGRDRSRVRERSRERSMSPTPEREREKAFERRQSRSPTPLKERSPQSKESRNDYLSDQKEVKAPKRERERDQ